MQVDFPDPLGPITATNSPAAMSNRRHRVPGLPCFHYRRACERLAVAALPRRSSGTPVATAVAVFRGAESEHHLVALAQLAVENFGEAAVGLACADANFSRNIVAEHVDRAPSAGRCRGAGTLSVSKSLAPGRRGEPADCSDAPESGRKRSAAFGIRSTPSRLPVTIVAFAVIPGRRRPSVLSTASEAAYVTTFVVVVGDRSIFSTTASNRRPGHAATSNVAF